MDVDGDALSPEDCSFEDGSIWTRVPRKLNFSPEPDNHVNEADIVSQNRHSPPCRPLRTLRLTEKPSTPNTIFLNSNRKNQLHPPVLCGRLSAPNFNPFTPESVARSRKRTRTRSELQCSSPIEYMATERCVKHDTLNNNNIEKPPEPDAFEDDNDEERPAKRLNLIESNTGLSRYITEFEEKRHLGTGEFGCVYLCTNRMDGCDYAIKKSNKPIVPGSANERRALKEVFAHAVLGKHENVVRYFTAWSENKHMLIQNEYCNGGSLQDLVEENRQNDTHLSESDLRRLIVHLSQGLRYIHSHNLVHMDIKPGNIFISRDPRARLLNCKADDSFDEEEDTVVYKFGDFGHVTSIKTAPKSVEEGDARYLALEVFHDDYSNLTKADMFALGLTVFEAAGGGPLQKNGAEWHELRHGKVPEIKHLPKDLTDLITQMTHEDPNKRPSAADVLKHSAVMSPANKTKEQLERELQATKTRFLILEKKFKAFSSLCKSEMLARDMPSGVRTRSNARLVGRTCHRSQSATEFGW